MKSQLINHGIILAAITFVATLISCKSDHTSDSNELSKEDSLLALAKRIHESVITLDTHNDINVANFTSEKNYTMDLPTQVNLPKMEAGGLDVSWLIVYTGQKELNEQGYKVALENAMSKFEAIHRLCEEIAPDQIELALTSEDVRRIHASGKKVAMIGVENGYPIGTDLSNVEKFHSLGARYMSLAHNGHSQLSDSNTGEADSVWLHEGLSDLGRQVISEMNRLGIMIDISHPSKKANLQMMEMSKAPVIASHSSARALCNHSRNLDDEQLEALKVNGGVVQAVAFSSYVNTEKNSAFAKARDSVYQTLAQEKGWELLPRREWGSLTDEAQKLMRLRYDSVREAAKPRLEELKKTISPVNVADFVDHIDYLVQKIGIDHVGISSDFDGGGGVEGWNDASETFNVTLELVRRGYSEEEIEKLWSGNLLRVLDEVQRVAAEISAGKM